MVEYRGYAGIHLAANLGYAEPLRYLLTLPQVQVDLHTRTGKETALHLAARKYGAATDILINAVRINEVNGEGEGEEGKRRGDIRGGERRYNVCLRERISTPCRPRDSLPFIAQALLPLPPSSPLLFLVMYFISFLSGSPW